MSRVIEILRALEPLGEGGTAYLIRATVSECYVARGPTGHAAFLVPMELSRPVPGRAFEGFTLDFSPAVRFELDGRAWESGAAVLECTDEKLLRTFCALIEDLTHEASGSHDPRTVLEALRRWEALLRKQPALTPEEEIGLWGELWFLRSLPDLEYGLRAWRGPEGGAADFFANSVAIECKTTLVPLSHHISHSQLAAETEAETFLNSLAVVKDPARGITLPELVASIEAGLIDLATWELRLLQSGFRRNAVSSYSTKFSELEPPLWFEMASVPRVRQFDRGVRHLRYMVELDRDSALDRETAGSLVSRFRAQ